MNKYLIICIVSFLALGKSKAQFGVGIELGLAPAIEDILRNDVYPGASIKLDYSLKENKILSLSAGAYGNQSTEFFPPFYTEYKSYTYLYPLNLSYQKIYGNSKIKRLMGVDLGLLLENFNVYYFDPNFVKPLDVFNYYLGLGATLGAKMDLTENLDISLTSRPQLYFGHYKIQMLVFWVNFGVTYKL